MQEDLLRVAREDLAFFSNEHKPARESWIVEWWLLARGQSAHTVKGGDPPDFLVDGVGVEVVELQQPGRRRGYQYRAKVEAATAGLPLARRMVSRKRVSEHGHEWVLNSVEAKSKKYAPQASVQWRLLIYVNVPFADCLSWRDVESGLAELAPAFLAIEVVFDTGAGPTAATVWRRAA